MHFVPKNAVTTLRSTSTMGNPFSKLTGSLQEDVAPTIKCPRCGYVAHGSADFQEHLLVECHLHGQPEPAGGCSCSTHSGSQGGEGHAAEQPDQQLQQPADGHYLEQLTGDELVQLFSSLGGLQDDPTGPAALLQHAQRQLEETFGLHPDAAVPLAELLYDIMENGEYTYECNMHVHMLARTATALKEFRGGV